MIRLSIRTKVKAASLYIVIVIALVIALLCGALICTAFYFRQYHALRERSDRLQNKVASGLNLLLAEQDSSYFENRAVALTEDPGDTIRMSKRFWGGFDIGVSTARTLKDSAGSAILIGNQPDSSKWSAIWLADEDRPLSLSGPTVIRGNVYLPKSGLRTAYVDNRGYEGKKELVEGKQKNSQRELPIPNLARLNLIDRFFSKDTTAGMPVSDSIFNSFAAATRSFRFKSRSVLEGMSIRGNVIIRCDSLLTIDSTTVLDGVLVFARAIVVRPGFKGRCQLFARDSISVGDRAIFNYPSVLGLIRTNDKASSKPDLIRLGKNCSFYGGIMTWEKKRGEMPQAVYLGKNGQFSGQLYTGMLGLDTGTVIHGSVTCRRFRYQTLFSLYENYLIGGHIDAKDLSPYYSSPAIFPAALKNTKKIVQWLN